MLQVEREGFAFLCSFVCERGFFTLLSFFFLVTFYSLPLQLTELVLDLKDASGVLGDALLAFAAHVAD